MSKPKKQQSNTAAESGPRHTGKNVKPSCFAGPYSERQLRKGRELPAKYGGGHDSGKTHHETASRRDESKPQATPAKQLFAEVK
jgi:hypothetical protein